MKTTISDLANTLFSSKKEKGDISFYGVVIPPINEDGSYNVKIADAEDTVKCDKLVGANVGDTVRVVIQKSGRAVVTETVGGDRDAEFGKNVAQYVWTKTGTSEEAGVHITEVPQENFESEATGGNVLIKSAGIYIRQGLTKLLQVLSTGITVGPENSWHIFIGSTGITFYNGPLSRLSITYDTDADESKIVRKNAAAYAENTYNVYKKEATERMRVGDPSDALAPTAYSETYRAEDSSHAVMAATYERTSAGVEATGDISDSTVNLFGTNLTYNNQKPFDTYIAGITENIGANTGADLTLTGTCPDGYIPIAIQEIQTNHRIAGTITAFRLSGNDAIVSIRNNASSAQSYTVTAKVLCTCLQTSL